MSVMTSVIALTSALASRYRGLDCSVVAELLDSFLFPVHLTLARAIDLRFIYLVMRMARNRSISMPTRLLQDHQYNAALVKVLEQQDQLYAQRLVRVLREICVTHAVMTAASLGMTEFLQFLLDENIPACWGGHEILKAARHGHFATVVWLKHSITCKHPQPILRFVARRGSPSLLCWVLEKTGERLSNEAFYGAAGSGQLVNLQFLASRLQGHPKIDAAAAARGGHIQILIWLNENGGVFSTRAMDVAAESGQLRTVKWLHANRTEGCTTLAIDMAAHFGHYDTVVWLTRNRREGCSSAAMRRAIVSGRMDIVKWLHFNFNMQWQGNLIDIAARHCDIEMVKWFHWTSPFSCTHRAMDNAAISGRLDTFQWLHFNRRESCSSAAVTAFARHGDLEALKFIDEVQISNYTPIAVDNAAAAGYVHVVRWLVQVKGVGFTSRAMDEASGNGHLAVVVWLHENLGSATVEAMNSAAENGHFNIVKWLNEERIEGCTEEAMDRAARNGHFIIMQYLHRFRAEGCSINASIGAAASGHLYIIKWLRAFFHNRIHVASVIQAAQVFGWSSEDVDAICKTIE